MIPTGTHTTSPLAERPIRVCCVNNSDNYSWNFQLGYYLAARLPCLQATTGHNDRAGGLQWNVEQLGPIQPSDAQTLRTLVGLSPPAWEFSPNATVKDAIIRLGNWIIETVRDELPAPMVEVLIAWLRGQWARYVPQSVLAQCDWADYLWRSISVPDNAHLVVDGKDYGVLPCLVGHLELHPVGLQQGQEGDIYWKWRYQEEPNGPNPQDADRARFSYPPFFAPAHLCDTLEYSFSEIRPILDPVDGWQMDANGYPMRRYERMDDAPRFPIKAPNGEGYLHHEDGRLVLEDYDPWIPHLMVHFHRGGHAAMWLTQAHGGANHLIETTDHWVMHDQVLDGSLAVQRISEAMPHFVFQTLAMRLTPVLDSFQRQARSLIGLSRQLPDPIWLRTGPLRATLDTAWREWERGFKYGAVSPETDFHFAFHAHTPQSSELRRSLEWLEREPTAGESPIPELLAIGWRSRIIAVADLAGQIRDLRVQRRQALIETHRQITGLFEGLLRTFFGHASIATSNRPNSGISILFCEWVASCDGRRSNRPGNSSPYSHDWYKIVHNISIEVELSRATGGSIPRLAEIMRRIADSAAKLHGAVPPTSFVSSLLLASNSIVGTGDVGNGAWTRSLVNACQLRPSDSNWRPEDCTAVNLLLTGLMLIEMRNFLTHGQEPLGVESPEGTATVTNYEASVSVIVDAESLEMCFRLFVAAATLVIVVGGLNPRGIGQDTTDRDLFLR